MVFWPPFYSKEPARFYSGRTPAVDTFARPCGENHRSGGILMKSLAKKMQRFLVSGDGPTAVDCAVMLAVAAIVYLTAISSLGTEISATF